MLEGPRLSTVQSYASVALDAVQTIDEYKRDDRELRMAYLASGNWEDPAELFDEFKEIISDDDAEIIDGSDADGNAVSTKWDFSNAQMTRTPEEVEEDIRRMLEAAASGTHSLEEATFGEWM